MRTLTTLLGNSQKLDGGAMFGNARARSGHAGCSPMRRTASTSAAVPCWCATASATYWWRPASARSSRPPCASATASRKSATYCSTASPRSAWTTPTSTWCCSPTCTSTTPAACSPPGEGQPARLLFPNAHFVSGRRHWQRARQPHPRDRASFVPELLDLLQASGRLELLDDGERSAHLGEGWRFHFSEGHTPGQMLPEIAMPDGPVVFSGDLIPGAPWVHLPLTMGYDRFPEGLIEERNACWTASSPATADWSSPMIRASPWAGCDATNRSATASTTPSSGSRTSRPERKARPARRRAAGIRTRLARAPCSARCRAGRSARRVRRNRSRPPPRAAAGWWRSCPAGY